MAHIPRAMAVGAPTGYSGGKPAAGTRNIANVEAMPVEELSPGFGVYYNDANLRFQDYGYLPGERYRNPQRLPSAQRYETPSQSYMSMFELAQNAGDVGGPVISDGAPVFSGTVSRVIEIYETNARVTAGEAATRGESLSMTL